MIKRNLSTSVFSCKRGISGPKNSFALPSLDIIDSDAIDFDWTESTDQHLAMESTHSRTNAAHSSLLNISLTDDESDDGSNDTIGNLGKRVEDAFAGEQKTARSKVRCTAPNDGKCKDSFDSWNAMTKYHAGGISDTFECHLCKKSFMSKRYIQQHINAAHIEPKCSESSSAKAILTRHIDSKQGSLKPFGCPNGMCSKRFSRKSHLKQHIAAVHLRLKPFGCPNVTCSRWFSHKSELKRHNDAVHLRLKPFQCPNLSCSMRFSQKGNLKNHINSKHFAQRLFECSFGTCSKRFYQKVHLQSHMKSAHEESK